MIIIIVTEIQAEIMVEVIQTTPAILVQIGGETTKFVSFPSGNNEKTIHLLTNRRKFILV